MQIGRGSLAGLAELRDYERHRLSSYEREGGNLDFLVHCRRLDPSVGIADEQGWIRDDHGYGDDESSDAGMDVDAKMAGR